MSFLLVLFVLASMVTYMVILDVRMRRLAQQVDEVDDVLAATRLQLQRQQMLPVSQRPGGEYY